MSDEHEHKHDAQEVKEILSVVSTEIPKLLESISAMIYKQENAEQFGKSVAQFFKQMKDAGMDDKQAYELTQKFMSSFSIGGMLGTIMAGQPWKNSDSDEVSREVKERIKERIKKKLDEEDED